jgi:subtilisin family serine protease
MLEREYIVSLNKGVDYDSFWQEMESDTNGLQFVPDRRIDIINNRDGSLRSCHYSLTDDEATILQNDTRVYSVEIPLKDRDDVIMVLRGRQIDDFTKSSLSAGSRVNWGLNRINSPTNNYGANTTTTSNYDYILDGTGVDVVIQDSGIEVNHPEFKNNKKTTAIVALGQNVTGSPGSTGFFYALLNRGEAAWEYFVRNWMTGTWTVTGDLGSGITSARIVSVTYDADSVFPIINQGQFQPGVSYNFTNTGESGDTRVQLIDWYGVSGIGGTQSANHYRDYDGHGTHVAGIAAGRTFGWAKNARIYSLKVSGLEGTGDSGTGISVSDCFDVIKLWHRNKPRDPVTGFKRPTIVNMSWGYSLTYTSVSSVTYRGNTFSDASTTGNAGYRWTNYGLVNLTNGGNFVTNFRQGQVDVDIQEMIDEGIHVIIAAGNNYHKIEIPAGVDYNNYLTFGGTDYYYHRGSSPLDDQAIKVGSIDNNVFAANLDQVSNFSEKGPGVDVWAPGSNVMSACSNTNDFSAVSYSKDAGFKQVSISGTSMAAPQVCGVGALYLQMNPGINPGQMKTWLTNTAKVTSVIYTTNTSNDYTTTRSLLGAPNKFLYNPFGIESDGSMSGAVTLTNGAFTLT